MQYCSVKHKNVLAVLLCSVLLVISGLLLFAFLSSGSEPVEEIGDFRFQTVTGDTFTSDSTSLRFVFTVGSLNYIRVGFAISKTNKNPTVGGQNCTVHETTVVYSAITADGKTVPAPTGRFWVAVRMKDISHASFNEQIYVNAFVEDDEGIRYASPRRITVREGFESEYKFTPVLRVVLASDIHTRIEGEAVDDKYNATRDEDELSRSRTEQLFRATYNYADGENYKGVDAVLVAGDYTDDGRISQYNRFFQIVSDNIRPGTELLACLGNHEFRNTGEDSVNNHSSFSGTYNRFLNYFGAYGYSGVDDVRVINGYTFIGFSPDKQGGRGFSASKAAWLDDQLEAAAASDPTGRKPIFVYGHVPVWETCLGSIRENDYDTDGIGAVLKKYPQAVYISGHTHVPCCDPESVWQGGFTVNTDDTKSELVRQGGFTAINTGTFANEDCPFYTGDGTTRSSFFQFDAHGAYQEVMLGRYFERSMRYASVYTIMEVDANGVVRLRYYNADADCFMFEPVLITSIGDPDLFSFTDERKEISKAPTFSEPLSLLTSSFASIRVGIPNATCPDYVRSYRVDLIRNGVVVDTVYRQACQHILPPPEITASFSGLDPDTDYTVRVYAYNAYGKMSDPITVDAHTDAVVANNPAPDVFSFGFDGEGVARNLLTGEALTAFGEPTVLSDGSGGYYAAFDGDDAYKWNGIGDFYDAMNTGFTFEWIGQVYDTVRGGGDLSYSYDKSRYVNLASNQETGGMGLEYNADGKAYLFVYVMTSNKTSDYYGAGATIPVGETVHLVGTYDGSTIRFYVNGTLAATKEIAGKVWFPLKEDARYLVVGGDSTRLPWWTERNMNGETRAMNVYSAPLSADEVLAKYQASGVGN